MDNDKLRVLVVLPADVIGGLETLTLGLLKRMDASHAVLLTQASICDYFSGAGITTHVFDDYQCTHPNSYSPKNIWKYAAAIKTVVGIERPDVVFGLTPTSMLYAAVAKDIFSIPPVLVGNVAASLSGYFDMIGRLPTRIERLLIQYSLNRCKTVIVPSQGVRNDLITHFGARGEKVTTIYNGIDVEHIRAAAQEPVFETKDCPWLVTACRLSHQKDFPTLMNAFKKIREQVKAKLIIVGDGELLAEIGSMVQKLALDDDVVLTGFKRNPFPYIARADVFVLSSLFEGFGLVILEAMALGIPVVASDCPSGPSEIIFDGENGYLVPVGSSQSIADRCLELIRNDTLRRAFSLAGQERVKDFLLDHMVANYMSCMQQANNLNR